MSKVVFVGNVPYNMGEEQLIDVFKSVGQVIGFRLVFDRDTGKPKGYGFCEFSDHETALSAVRNLNNTDVGGRPLRIDLADSDPFLEGKTTVHGEIIDAGETRQQWRERVGDHRDSRGPEEGVHGLPKGAAQGRNVKDENYAFLRSLPRGVPLAPGQTALDSISHTLATMNPNQLNEVLAQMKAFVINHPEHARILLVEHPQVAYALFQALLLNKIVDPVILQRMLAATHAQGNGGGAHPSGPPPSMGHGPGQPPIPPPNAATPMMHQAPQQYPPHYSQPPPAAVPPPASYYRPPPSQAAPAPPPVSNPTPVQAPPAAPPAPPSNIQTPHQQQQSSLPPTIDNAQREMLMQVLALSPEQINSLPPNEREAIRQLKSQFVGA